MGEQPVSRRARYRAETHEEAKAIALRQLAEGGIGAVSLNAIGKEMGVTGPALYRYFASRDSLLSSLIMDGYRDLATVVEGTAQKNQQQSPRQCLRALADAVRLWALAQPHRYLLLYGTPVPGYVAPDETVAIASRILLPFLNALSALPLTGAAPNSRVSMLEAQLATWAQMRNLPASGYVLRYGLIWWARLQGLISLEIEGHFSLMGFDPALLYETEVEALLDSISGTQ